MVKLYDVIKWQNVKKLCFNILALPYRTSNKKCSLVCLIYLNLFKDHFSGGICVSPHMHSAVALLFKAQDFVSSITVTVLAKL